MNQARTDRLSDFAYGNHRLRWKFYLWTMIGAFLYGGIRTLVFDGSEEIVTYEVLALCVVSHVVFLSYYLLSARPAVAIKKRRRQRVVSKPKPSLAPTWRFPRFLPYAAVAATIIMLLLARANPSQLRAKLLAFALTYVPSSSAGAHVPRILDEARDGDVVVSPSVLRRSGYKFIRASENHPDAWAAAKATLDYRSFLNEQLNLAPKVEGATEPPPGLPYMFGLNLKQGPGTWLARIKVLGSAPPNDSARMEMLSKLQPRGTGAKIIVIEGRESTIALDDTYLKDVVVQDAKVEYDGGPLKLENVYFVNCQFVIPPSEQGRGLARAILSGGATNFEHPGKSG
jgi:hypothetical protein